MDIIPKKALVVLSGGQDSTTALFWAKTQFDEVHAITFDYGQRHILELEAAHKVASLANVKSHRVVRLIDVLRSTSPLVDMDEHLETYTDAQQMASVIGDRVEKTFVPMRNALFLTIAANHAIALGAFDIVTGVCQEDNANYPDCRQVFIDATQHMIYVALGLDTQNFDTHRNFVIHTPLMGKSKAETVQMAWDMAHDTDPTTSTRLAWHALAYTHTSYSGEFPPRTQDHATVLRASGFEQAGKPDPLIVRAVEEGLMPLPTTSNYDDMRQDLSPKKVDTEKPSLKVGEDPVTDRVPLGDDKGVEAKDAKTDDHPDPDAAFKSGDQGTDDDPNRGEGEGGQATDPTGDSHVDQS